MFTNGLTVNQLSITEQIGLSRTFCCIDIENGATTTNTKLSIENCNSCWYSIALSHYHLHVVSSPTATTTFCIPSRKK